MQRLKLIAIPLLLSLPSLNQSCSVLKAGPAPDSGFLSAPERLAKNELLPFHAWWVKTGVGKSKGGKLYVAPVNLAYLKQSSEWSRIELLTNKEIRNEAAELGKHFQQSLKEEFKQSKDERFSLVNDPSKSVGILEVAIVELVPNDVARTAAGSVAGALIPGAGIIAAGSGGSIAIEGRFRITKTREVVAMFKDREKGQIAPVDIAGFTHFRYARKAIDDWAAQIVEMIESPPGAAVADSSPFTLLPW